MAKGQRNKGAGAKAHGKRNANASKRKVYLGRLAKIFGVREAAAEDMASVELMSSLRINALSPLSEDDILSRLIGLKADITPIDWCPNGYYLHSDKRVISESDLFQDGHVYIQNASSLIPALALAPQPGERILDVCAAPGGKTAHIQALAGNQAVIYANDAMKPRLQKLEDVLTTFHVHNTTITNFEGQFIDRHLDVLGDAMFDRILLDAQCSGEGMEDLSHPGALRFWSEERVTKMSFLQQKMLSAAWKRLKPGGTLVYSTCTYGPEENEGPVSRHLKHHENAEVVPIDFPGAEHIPGRKRGMKSWNGKPFHDSLKHGVRVLPSPHLEGFFVCRLIKTG